MNSNNKMLDKNNLDQKSIPQLELNNTILNMPVVESKLSKKTSFRPRGEDVYCALLLLVL